MIKSVVRGMALVFAVHTDGAAALIPLRAFGQLPNIEMIRLSPDGSKYAVVTGNETARQVQIRETGTNTLINLAQAGPVKIRDLQWVGDRYLLTTSSATAQAIGIEGPKREWLLGQLFDCETRRWNRILEGTDNGMNIISGSPVVAMTDGKPVLVVPGVSFPTQFGVSTLYRIKPESRVSRTPDVGNEATIDWVVGADGRAVARADYIERTGSWSLFVRNGASWKRAYTETALIDPPDLRGLGRDAQTVLISTRASGDWQTRAVNIADATMSPPLDGLDDASILRDPATRTMIGTVTSDMESVGYTFIDPGDQKMWAGIRKAFAGESVSLLTWSADRQKIVVEVEGANNGDALYLVNRTTHSADWLGDHYAGVAPGQTAERRVIRYKAADGTEIPAYLTLPRARDAKRLPLIVLAHGGPAARDEPGFDWWSQALASRGYAVLQPQFRGSDGFGTAHLAAGYGQWGRKMQTDLSDGVRQLVKDGTVDPVRVCIAGGSYGGYAALAGAALDPGVYRCAVSVAGVSDLRRFLRWQESRHDGSKNSHLRYWQRFIGAQSSDDRSIDALSPALHAAAVKVPVLLIHGRDDTVVPYEQSQVMADALRKSGAPVELIPLTAEDHWLSRSATRIQMLEALVAFLEKHNPPAPAAGAATLPP